MALSLITQENKNEQCLFYCLAYVLYKEETQWTILRFSHPPDA